MRTETGHAAACGIYFGQGCSCSVGEVERLRAQVERLTRERDAARGESRIAWPAIPWGIDVLGPGVHALFVSYGAIKFGICTASTSRDLLTGAVGILRATADEIEKSAEKSGT